MSGPLICRIVTAIPYFVTECELGSFESVIGAVVASSLAWRKLQGPSKITGSPSPDRERKTKTSRRPAKQASTVEGPCLELLFEFMAEVAPGMSHPFGMPKKP